MRFQEMIAGMEYVPRVLFLTPILCMLLLAPVGVQATHSASEPSDGTVRSFIDVKPPRKIVPFYFYDKQGREITLADFRGKIVLLNLWATWCPPCVQEMPALDRLQAKFPKTDFVVMPLSLDRDGIARVQGFYLRYELRNLDVFSDPGSAARAGFPVDVLPASFIIGRDGRLKRFLRSFVNWDDPEAEAMIRRLISTQQSDEKR